MSETYRDILYEVEGSVAIVTLNRPERMNAWTQLMGLEIQDALAEAEADDKVRAVVLTGSGTRAFCAGADLEGGEKTFGVQSLEVKERRFERAGKWPNQMVKPVIAAINGHAVGVGLTLPMMCDIRFVAQHAKLQFAFVKRGIVPELGSPVTVPRVVGFQRAADLMMTGRLFSGEDAVTYGLALEALPAEEVRGHALRYAQQFAEAAPVSVALTKHLMWEGLTKEPATSQAEEGALLAWIGSTDDAKEGVLSFMEKRAPEWRLSADRDLPRDLLGIKGDRS